MRGEALAKPSAALAEAEWSDDGIALLAMTIRHGWRMGDFSVGARYLSFIDLGGDDAAEFAAIMERRAGL